jgi:signal transduction histidine kinase
MRLIDKFTLWFIVITSIVLIAGGLIVFTRVQHEIDQEAIRRIKSHIDNVARQLVQGQSPATLKSEYVAITEIDPLFPPIDLMVYDTMAVYRPNMRALDRKLTIESSYIIRDKHYLISMHDFVAEPDEIADGVTDSLALIFLILLVIVAVTNVLISRRILSPFHRTMKAIEDFSLKKEKPISLPKTRTKEFQQLNHFLVQMMAKAQSDYKALKEFTENASHELQTPLAVIRGKLELLLESPINEEQGNQILAALNSIEKLSKINHALTLLNKLENQEFSVVEPVNFGNHVRNILHELSELIEMKGISLKTEITDANVVIHPSLADILIMNLLSNAIRHNFENGSIFVSVTTSKLQIENTGHPPEIPLDKAFERFKRTSQNNDSVGLGLSIVKQICEVTGMDISYEYRGNRHIVRLTFPG